jgi:hypothetical protein
MTQTTEEKNKAFVLEAFEALFNKRDYAAAERFWSPNYIRPGRRKGSSVPRGLRGSGNPLMRFLQMLRQT